MNEVKEILSNKFAQVVIGTFLILILFYISSKAGYSIGKFIYYASH
jgi:hypothetical protein